MSFPGPRRFNSVEEALEFLESEDLCVVEGSTLWEQHLEIWQCGDSYDEWDSRPDDIGPVAYVVFSRDETYSIVMNIHYFGVHRNWRGRGIGEALNWILQDYLMEMPMPPTPTAIWTNTTSFGVIRLRSKVFGVPHEVDNGTRLLSPEEVKEELPESSPEQPGTEGYGIIIDAPSVRVTWLVHGELGEKIREDWEALD